MKEKLVRIVGGKDMKEKLKKIAEFIANPRLVFCFAIAWMITNGWSYVLLGLGTFFQVPWMIAVASAYLAFLWFPFTPEKIITVIIAICLLRWLFPKDEKTLGMLIKLKESFKQKRQEKKEKEDA